MSARRLPPVAGFSAIQLVSCSCSGSGGSRRVVSRLAARSIVSRRAEVCVTMPTGSSAFLWSGGCRLRCTLRLVRQPTPGEDDDECCSHGDHGAGYHEPGQEGNPGRSGDDECTAKRCSCCVEAGVEHTYKQHALPSVVVEPHDDD